MRSAEEAVQEGIIQAQAGNHQAAIPLYQEALDNSFAHPECAHMNMGLSFQALGQHQEAITAFGAAIGIYANNPDLHNTNQYVQSYYHKTISHYSLGDFGNTIITAEHGIALDNNRNIIPAGDLPRLKAYALTMSGRYAEALGSYTQALIDNPQLEQHITDEKNKLFARWREHAATLQAEETTLGKAVQHYQALLSLNPNDALAHEGLGDALTLQGQDKPALGSYLSARKLGTTTEELDEKITDTETTIRKKERLTQKKMPSTQVGNANNNGTTVTASEKRPEI